MKDNIQIDEGRSFTKVYEDYHDPDKREAEKILKRRLTRTQNIKEELGI